MGRKALGFTHESPSLPSREALIRKPHNPEAGWAQPSPIIAEPERGDVQGFRRANETPTAEIRISTTRITTKYDRSAAGVTVSLSLVTTSVNVQLAPGGNHPQKSVTLPLVSPRGREEDS